MSSLGALTIRDADFFDPGTFSNESPALKLLPPPKEVPGKQAVGGKPLGGFKAFRGVGGPLGAILNMLWVMQGTLKTIARNTSGKLSAGAQALASTGAAETETDTKPEKVGILGSLKGAFSGLIPKDGFGDKLKILAFAGALWALSKWSDEIVPVVAKIVKFTKEKLMPMLMKVLDFIGVTDEEGNISWPKLLGMSLVAYLAMKMGPALLKLAFMVGGTKVIGIAAVAAWGVASVFQAAGDWAAARDWSKEVGATDNETLNKIGGLLAGDLEGGIGNAFKNASKWAGIGATLGIPFGPPGMLIGGIIGGMVGGILGWLGGGKIARAMEWVVDGFNSLWNNVTTAISDVFFDREITTMVAGKEMKHTQRSSVGKLKDSIDQIKVDIQEWISGVWEKMTGWIPSWDDIKDKWGDMKAKTKEWDIAMTQWFKDMWEKMTGWIPTVADIKESVGDMKVWIKNMMIDVKNWFWDASKPQIIGIDLSKISDAFPSIEGIKEGILSTLPDWMRPKTLEQQIGELEDKIERSEAGENVFFGRETKGRKKAKEKIAELRALLLEEAEEAETGSIDGVSNRMNFEVANMRKVASTSGKALAAVASARGIDESQRTMTTFVDGKAINSYNQQKTDVNIIEPGAADPDGTAKNAWSGQGFNLAAFENMYR